MLPRTNQITTTTYNNNTFLLSSKTKQLPDSTPIKNTFTVIIMANNNNNKDEYQHLEEEEEYVPTTNAIEQQQQQAHQQPQPTATTTTTGSVTYQLPPQQTGQPVQYFYVVQPPPGASDQQQQGVGQQQLYYPQVYYPHLMMGQQQQPTRLPPLPQVSQPQHANMPNQNNYAYPTTNATIPTTISNTTQIPITQESYVNVQGVEPILILICSFLMPGLGHLVMGQQSKGAIYFGVNFVIGIIIAATAWIFVGLAFIPFALIYVMLIMIDSYVLADRLKKGYPVLKGECYFRITSWGVSLLEKKSPVFVHGVDEPLEWQQKCEQVRRQLNL